MKTFAQLVREHAVSIGATVKSPLVPTMSPQFTVETKYGPLTYHISETKERGRWYRIMFSRFSDPEQAREGGLDCNPFSGKWNWYYGNLPAQEAFNRWKSQLENILDVHSMLQSAALCQLT